MEGQRKSGFKIKIDDIWDDGMGDDGSVVIIDEIEGFTHDVIFATDGSWAENFPELGLRLSAGGWIEDFPSEQELRPAEYFEGDE
jgi:hypothetical protein